MTATRQAGAQTSAPPDAGVSVASADEVQALLMDIFALTGQKVQKDDPLVAAALIHSALLRRAGQEAAQAVQEAAQRAVQDLECCLQRQAASDLHQARQPGPGRATPMSCPALALPCLLAGALGAAITLAAARWRA